MLKTLDSNYNPLEPNLMSDISHMDHIPFVIGWSVHSAGRDDPRTGLTGGGSCGGGLHLA